MASIEESCFFFPAGDSGQKMYGCTYLPCGQARPTGVVLVSPLGRERLRIYRESANLARDLAAQGFAAIRFDYRGEGESDGAFERASITSRIQDIAFAAAELARAAEIKKLCLLGLQLGATLAVAAASSISDPAVGSLVLCDPICNPRAHAKNLLRTNIILQSQYYGEVLRKEQEIRQDLLAGGTVSLYGFFLGQPLLEELEGLDLTPHLEGYEGDSVLIYMHGKEVPPKKDLMQWKDLLGSRGRCETICTVINFSWTSRKMWMPRLVPLSDTVCQWLQAHA